MAMGSRHHPWRGQVQLPRPGTPRQDGWARRLPPHVLPLLEDQHLYLKNIAYQHFTYISAESTSCSAGGSAEEAWPLALQNHEPRANEEW